MPRTIPIQLQEALQQDATTLCTLVKVTPKDTTYPAYGAALLDVAVVYDDGDGELTYSPVIGAQPSALMYAADLSVDGGNTDNLLPEFDVPVSEADLASGVYDFSTFTMMLVDYKNLSAGHVLLLRGTLGRITINDDGLSFVNEMRGLSQALKQTITEKWSLGCRATFGSRAEHDSSGDGVVERYPCNFPVDTLWESGTVVSVGFESNRQFIPSALSPSYGGVPGMVRWITGANAGRSYEVESFDSDGIGLTFPAMFPIQVGDDFEFRDDCPKTVEACKARNNWPNFRGEPNIPVADAGQIAAPGASAGVGTGGAINTDFTDPA
jgi:uncharacterized phage protein (TIGR02218 family)